MWLVFYYTSQQNHPLGIFFGFLLSVLMILPFGFFIAFSNPDLSGAYAAIMSASNFEDFEICNENTLSNNASLGSRNLTMQTGFYWGFDW